MAQRKDFGPAQGSCRGDGGVQGRQGSPPSSFLISPLFYSIHSSNAVRFPCGHLCPFAWRSSLRRTPSPPASPVCFPPPLGRPSGKEQAFGSGVQTFQEKRQIFRTFFVFLPSFCRALSVRLPPFFHNCFAAQFGSAWRFSPETPMFSRKQRLFSVRFPFFFRPLAILFPSAI